MEKIIGYKVFDKNLQCRGFQYEVGKEYTAEGEIECCKNGFHFCENPLELLRNVPTKIDRRYCKVEGDGETDYYDGKIAVSHIKILEEVGIEDLINSSIKFIQKREKALGLKPTEVTTPKSIAGSVTNAYSAMCTGWCSVAACTNGNSFAASMYSHSVAACTNLFTVTCSHQIFSAAVSTEDFSAAKCESFWSVAVCTGGSSVALCNGLSSAAVCTNRDSIAYNTGCHSAAISMESSSAATNTGAHSISICAGHDSEAKVEGIESVAIAFEKGCRAMGALGCWLFLVEREENGQILTAKAVKVDGEKIKAGKFYALKNGQIIEA